jgi:TetR/AcrR family transcriptional repressor of nem operon
MDVARSTVQAHGLGALSFRDLAKAIGIKSASIHYHFPTKGDLGAALARRYREDAAATLAAVRAEEPDAAACLARYTAIFRRALENENRMCLCNFLAAETDDLPAAVLAEVRAFADINVAWLAGILEDAGDDSAAARTRGLAIHAAVGGAQLAARSRGDVAVYDAIIAAYRATGLIPA